MLLRTLIAEKKGTIISLIFFLFLFYGIKSFFFLEANQKASKSILGLDLTFGLIILLILVAFVVFGIKGFYEKFSHKKMNIIIFFLGILLAGIIFYLAYEILFLR